MYGQLRTRSRLT